jgi:type I restriction enzyme S subunit
MNGLKPYDKYKSSGIAWLGDIPEHWEISKAKHILFQKKKTLNPNLNCGSISFGNIVFKDNERVPVETKATYQELLIGEFLINPLNLNFDLKSLRTGLSTIDVVVSTGYIVLQNNPKFNKRYLKWLLHQFDVSFMKTLGDGVRQTLSYNDFKNTNFPYISIPEQTAIARFLDYKLAKINRFIQKKKQLIKLLNEQKAAIINQAVTKGLDPNAKMKDSGIEWLGEIPEHWEVTRAKYLGKAIIGLTYSPSDETDSENGILVLRSSNVQNGKITYDDCVYVTTEVPENKITRVGDILICSRNGSIKLIGKNALIDEEAAGQTFGAFMTIFRTPNYEFLHYFFNSASFKAQSGLFSTSTINQLTTGILNNIIVAIPKSLNEQLEIVEFIKSETEIINTTISKIEKELALTEEYKTALIAEAVTGKIDVRGYEVPEIMEEETYEEIEEELGMVAEDTEEYQTIEE